MIAQAPEERNYHIFYQYLHKSGKFNETGSNDPMKFNYLNKSMPVLKEIDDGKELQELLKAFKVMNFNDREVQELLGVVGAILCLGNIEFEEAEVLGTDGCKISEGSKKWAEKVAKIFGCTYEELEKALVIKTLKMKVGLKEELTDTPLTPSKATFGRHSLAKLYYGKLFSWIVTRINVLLAETQLNKGEDANSSSNSANASRRSTRASQRLSTTMARRSARLTSMKSMGAGGAGMSAAAGRQHTIGILDIAGFESFETNSLEQLFINLANENLQQHFNDTIFKQELAIYNAEGLNNIAVDFRDNQDVLDLVQGYQGLLWHLNEEVRLPK